MAESQQQQIDELEAKPGGKPEPKPKAEAPKGKTKGRDYRVFAQNDEGWADYGWFAGANQEAAIKAARQEAPGLRKQLSEGEAVVAIPAGHFEPLVVTIEIIEREAFKPAKFD